jgi:hypothetical protein
MTKSQKRQKPTSVEIERERAKAIYKSLMDSGHQSAFQLREVLGGISESSFYKMTRSIFREKPFSGIIRWEPMSKKWYSPQREHYNGETSEWILKPKFRERENEKST